MSPAQIQDVAPHQLEFTARLRCRPLWLVLLVSVAAGAALGSFDRALQDVLPYPLANLANSAAVWAVAAFAVGLWVTNRGWYGAAAGVVTLAVAVIAYYGASSVFAGDSFGWLTERATQFWLGFALIVGALLGAAGIWARDGDNAVRAVGLALAPSVLFAEALNLTRLATVQGDIGTRPGETAAIEALCGAIVLAALALFVARDHFDWLRCLLACVPISLIGFGLYTASGYGG